MPQEPKIWTYRVRQLPLEFGKAEVISTLQRHLQQDSAPPQVRVYSLAQDLASLHTSRTKTATVTIAPLPKSFRGQTRWTFETRYKGSDHNIIIDLDFLDFTVLNEVHYEEHTLDCIAISGLGSHPFGSWQHRGGSPFMWLRDAIPHDLPGIRSIIYGYDSPVPESNSFQRPHDIAARFANRLRSVGFGSSQSKPMVLLAHSLGGIILKEALIILAGISDQQHSILGNLRSVIFFGTPHKGMSTEQLITMVKHQPNEDLIRDLSPDSSYLFHVEQRFNGVQIPREFRVVSFYETKTTRTVQQGNDGTWSRTGPRIRMVDRQSAIQVCSRDPEDIYSVDEDHSEMVKFPAGDLNYKCVLDCLGMTISTLSRNPDQRLGSDLRVSEDRHSRGDGNIIGEARSSAASTMNVLEQGKPSSKEIISSLQLQILDRRRAEISQPYQSTFNWIFNEEALGFTVWLLNGQGAYWIQGKPGSGKSTLMKHITQHQYTYSILDRWSHPEKTIIAAFFFYHRGSSIQKSFDGLIRSVLLQILKAMPQLCDFIPKECLPQPRRRHYDWSSTNLDNALQSVLAHGDAARKICLFIDALDEFDGHLEVLADFLQSLIKGGCKVCFSSRPREILKRHFGSFPGMVIHNHTERDIRSYTVGRLAALPGLQHPSRLTGGTRNAVNNAVREIKQKANGVFLWVKLALDRIGQDGVVASTLSERLQEVPLELEDFYASIIERTPASFLWETYLTLDVIFRAHEEPSARDLFWILKAVRCQTLAECLEIRNSNGFSQFCHHLKEHCGGLIEISEPFNEEDRIGLMHETVREFIGGQRFQELIVGNAFVFNAQNGYTELAKFYLSDLKRPRGSIHLRPDHLKMCSLYSNLAEFTMGICQSQLIDELRPSDLKEAYYVPFWEPIPKCPTSPVDFAIRSGLVLYIKRKLANSEELESFAQEALQSLVRAATEKEVLHQTHKAQKRTNSDWWYADYDPDFNRIAQMILERTNSTSLISTAFKSLLLTQGRQIVTYYYTDPIEFRLRISGLHQSKKILDLARIFLDKGQDPNLEIIEDSMFKCSRYGRPKIPKPLHLAFDKMADLLLSYNADPNARDRLGRTPLDVAIQRIAISRLDHRVIIELMDMLMERGGCITRVGFRLFPECLINYYNFHGFSERLRDLPRRSVEHGFLSKFDLHVFPVLSGVDRHLRRFIEHYKRHGNDYL